jgi:hypothetical protein
VFVALNPGAMFFVADGLAVGGFLHLSYASSGPTWAYGGAPAVAGNFWLGDRVSVFPQASLAATWARVSNGGGTFRAISVQGFAPVLFHVVPHFFLGIGPAVFRELDVTNPPVVLGGGTFPVVRPLVTTVGVQSVIGGWF